MSQQIVMKIEGVTGDVQLNGYEEWNYTESVAFGASQSSTRHGMSGSNRSKVAVDDVTVVMTCDRSTPSLFSSLCKNSFHTKVEVTFLEQDGTEHIPYLELTLRDVVVSSFHFSGTLSEIRGIVTVTFNFRKINMVFNTKDKDGSIDGTIESEYDVAQNKAIK